MPMTLKQAAAFLAATPTPYKLPTLRKAVQSGELKSTLQTVGEINFRMVEKGDLLAWAEKQSQSVRGNPNIKSVRRKTYTKKASDTK